MNKWYDFILKILPDGKAFRSISYSKILWKVLADGLKMILDYGILVINDQVWFVNDNFDPIPWEARYSIIVPEFSTLEERQEVVKQYMLYPQSGNRLSRDYILSVVHGLGYTGIDIEYNSTGLNDGFLHANDFANEKNIFNLGALTYNSFTVSGSCNPGQYNSIINTIMSLKPMQVALYDKIIVSIALAWDNNTVLAWDNNTVLGFASFGAPAQWILENGTWNDNGVWIDEAIWND